MIIDSYVRRIQIVPLYPMTNANYYHVNELDILISNKGEVNP